MKVCPKPCPTCPWRVDCDAGDIPGFDLELAERLMDTCSGEYGARLFACHQSRDGAEFACAGWLASHGYDSIAVRILVMAGDVDLAALGPCVKAWAKYLSAATPLTEREALTVAERVTTSALSRRQRTRAGRLRAERFRSEAL